jgi:uncharacterized protein YbaP (TraB family)
MSRSLALDGRRVLFGMIRITRRPGVARPGGAARLGIVLGWALALAVGASARADPPLWRAKSAHGEVTMFGSVHLLSEATQWKTPALADALAHADEIWFEIPFDAAAQAQAGNQAVKRGMLPADRTLSKLLPAPVWASLAATAQAQGLDPQRLERLQPWLAEITVASAYLARRGAQEALGVEQQLYDSTPPSAAKKAFETPAQQIGFFADAPLADQIDSLKETLREIDREPEMFDRLAAAWASGDVKLIETEAVEDLRRDAPGMYERLVAARNRRWVGEIERLLKGGRRVLIVVGVGHLVGPDSVPALLRRQGVAVEGP